MTNTEFRAKLADAFNSYTLMNKRNKHTINELLYVLEYHHNFNNFADFNISICKKNGEWWSVPTLDSFVPTDCRSIWFEDERVEFEIEEFDGNKYYCLTIYESDKE